MRYLTMTEKSKATINP